MATVEVKPGDALVAVDVQADFLPGGSLAVPHGDEVIAPLNAWIGRFRAAELPVFASRDWHPANHCSFRPQGGPWPPHCVAGSPGAAFAADLALPTAAQVISKAIAADQDAYSAFSGTELDSLLRALRVKRLFVGGLATDYCVAQTVSDARTLGYEVVVLVEAVRAVDVCPGDGERALAGMRAEGALLLEP